MKKRKKEEILLPCAFNHQDCFSCSHGICRLLENMDFHGKDCCFYATKKQVQDARKKARDRLVVVGATHLINYQEYARGK